MQQLFLQILTHGAQGHKGGHPQSKEIILLAKENNDLYSYFVGTQSG